MDRGIPEAADVQGVSFADVDGDGDLDVYVARGRQQVFERSERAPDPGREGSPNHLLLNDGSGVFTDVTADWQAMAGERSESFGALFADYDRDGDQDALVVRDFEADHFLRNDGDAFQHVTSAISADGTSLMGMAVADFDGDGNLDVYSTDVGPDTLYLGDGDGTFDDVYVDWIDADPSASLTGWGVAAIDVDNDADADVMTVSAWEYADQYEDLMRTGAYVLLDNTGGAFTDIAEAAGLGEVVHGTALAIADYDLDGDLDVAVALGIPDAADFGPDPSEVTTGIRILRNDSARAAGKRFLEISLRDQGNKNAWAVGATVDVVAGEGRASRVVTAGDSYLSTHSFVQHFGLGDAQTAEVTISWPDGRTTRAHEVPAGYVRMAPHDGDCCWPSATTCEQPWPDCPTWASAADPCGGVVGCDVCQLVCDKLAECGLEEGCAQDCEEGPPEVEEAVCALSAPCDAIETCFLNGEDQE